MLCDDRDAKRISGVDKIANLDTVDGLFMDPYDLSLTRGRGQSRRQNLTNEYTPAIGVNLLATACRSLLLRRLAAA